MQRFDGLDLPFLWQLNERADKPDLAVILSANPEVISQRLDERGPHNRFQRTMDSSEAEVGFYFEATEQLIRAGYNVLVVDVNCKPPEQSAALVAERLMSLLAMHRM